MSVPYTPPKVRATYRDAAGELGITEGDHEPVLPEYGPDMHGLIARAILFARVLGTLVVLGAGYALGYFVGWVAWGQP